MEKTSNFNLAEHLDIVYVVIRNETRVDPKTKAQDEYTQILRVCVTEKNANDYIAKLKKSPLANKNVIFYAIPTPYGDVSI